MKITLQKIFDAAWNEFIVGDGRPATTGSGGCAYLTADGRKCAVGLALPDGHPAQESAEFFSDIVAAWPGLFGEDVIGQDASDLDAIQHMLHDRLCEPRPGRPYLEDGWCYTREERRQKYIEVAKEFGLKVPISGETA